MPTAGSWTASAGKGAEHNGEEEIGEGELQLTIVRGRVNNLCLFPYIVVS